MVVVLMMIVVVLVRLSSDRVQRRLISHLLRECWRGLVYLLVEGCRRQVVAIRRSGEVAQGRGYSLMAVAMAVRVGVFAAVVWFRVRMRMQTAV